MPYIDKKSAIDALKAIRYGLLEIDIPSPTVPEYVEHHEQIKNMMEITDGWIKKLEEQLTADVVERKKGKWIWMGEKGDSRFMCSVCNSKEDVPTCNGEPTIWWFCPNCGADMREENNNG